MMKIKYKFSYEKIKNKKLLMFKLIVDDNISTCNF